jgi:hypothetical protein
LDALGSTAGAALAGVDFLRGLALGVVLVFMGRLRSKVELLF